MDIFVTGPRKGNIDKGLRNTVTLATYSFARQLKISRLKTTIIVKMHHNVTCEPGVEGLCEAVSNRVFVLDIALYANWLSTLAHEMVHVRQFARGELNSSLSRWKSNKYCDNIEYWDQPWEKEARRLQNQLVYEYEKDVS